MFAYLKTVDNAKDDLANKEFYQCAQRGIGAMTCRVQDHASERGMGFMMHFWGGRTTHLLKSSCKSRAFCYLDKR